MNSDSIQDEHIDKVMRSVKRPEGELIFSLGVALVYLDVPPGVAFSAPYHKIGEELSQALEYELFHLICNGAKKEPQAWVQELISGDIRNLITGILTALVSTLSVPLAIAIPAVALLTKRGVVGYCARGKPKKPKKTLARLLKKASLTERGVVGRCVRGKSKKPKKTLAKPLKNKKTANKAIESDKK